MRIATVQPAKVQEKSNVARLKLWAPRFNGKAGPRVLDSCSSNGKK